MALPYSSLLLCLVIVLVFKIVHRYIARNPLDNVPGPTPHSFLAGDLGVLFHRHKGWGFIKKLEGYGSVARVQGTFGSRVLFVFDPVALQHIVAKDGIQYESPDYMLASNDILFGPGLLSVCGAQHRRQRKMLNPAFSAENLQKMTPMFYQLSHKLRQTLSELVGNTSREIDIIHWMSRAALEYVALGGMGHSFDPLLPHTRGPVIGKAIKNLVPLVYALTLLRMTSSYLRRLGPPQLRRKLANLLAFVVPDERLGKLRDVVNTMDDASRMVLNERALEKVQDGAMEGIMAGNDILSVLLKAHANSTPENGFTDQELIAQMTTLIFAGTDTTSNALGRVLQALSEHPEMQIKLREELASARDYPGQDIPYGRLMELPLLDAICRETLRVYSPVNIIPRVTITEVAMPLQKPICGVDGRMMSKLPIPKGTLILPCFLSCNTAKEIWGEDAEEWKPERWLSPLPASLTEARIPGVYSNLMTFGGGPRSCIGFRFSQLEMKVVLSVLLEHFTFSSTGRKIMWNLSGVCYPTMDEESIDPSMHLKLKALQGDTKY